MKKSTTVENSLIPYETIDYGGIQYSPCREFDHISRYRGLRQVVHNPTRTDSRYVSLENSNPFTTHCKVTYHEVTASEENRLDLIADATLGSATYAWVIAYFNQIDDGFTVKEGQRLAIPQSLTSLFNSGEILAPVSALTLNLGSE